MNTTTWSKFRERIREPISQIHQITKEKYTNNNNECDRNNIINTTLEILCNTIHQAAITDIGRTTIYDINKPWISNEIVTIINKLRLEKKGIITKILNRIRNIKSQSNGNISDPQIKNDIIANYGELSYHRYSNWYLRNKQKNKQIKYAKQIYQNKKIRQLATRDKSRFYYKTLDEISNVGMNKHQHIPSIIKPSVAVHHNQINVADLKKTQITKNSHETANEFNQYFNTIGTPINPNYKSTLQTNRNRVRQFDAPYDVQISNHPKYHQYINELNGNITKSTLHYHVKKLKNNKKVFDYNNDADNLHTLIIKQCIPIIDDLLLIIYNHWKNTASITPGVNIRALIPYRKYQKSPYTIKGYRPLAVEKILWKLYQMIINTKIQKYLHQMNIISIHQYAGKKGVGAEDCIMALCTDIAEQHINGIPTNLATFDSSDAYDAQHQMIIYDKFRYHAGFDMKGLIMVKSLLVGRKSMCITNGAKSDIIETLSGPYQGSPPASTIWCVYINPLLKHIEHKMNIKHLNNITIAKIKPFVYMDDITIITTIIQKFNNKYQSSATCKYSI